MRGALAVVMASASLSVAAACSSGGGSSGSASGKQAYIDAALRGYDSDAKKGLNGGVTRAQAKCVTEKILDALGVDRIRKEGFNPQSFETGSSTSKLIDELGNKKLESMEVACGIDPSKLGSG